MHSLPLHAVASREQLTQLVHTDPAAPIAVITAEQYARVVRERDELGELLAAQQRELDKQRAAAHDRQAHTAELQADHEAALQAKDERLRTEAARAAAAEGQAAVYAGQLAEMADKQTALEIQLRAAQADAAASKTALEKEREQRAAVQFDCEEAKLAVGRTEASLREEQRRVAEAKDLAAHRSVEIERLEKLLAASHETGGDRERTIERVHTELKDVYEENERLRTTIEAMSGKLAMAVEEMERMETDSQTLVRELESVRREHETERLKRKQTKETLRSQHDSTAQNYERMIASVWRRTESYQQLCDSLFVAVPVEGRGRIAEAEPSAAHTRGHPHANVGPHDGAAADGGCSAPIHAIPARRTAQRRLVRDSGVLAGRTACAAPACLCRDDVTARAAQGPVTSAGVPVRGRSVLGNMVWFVCKRGPS